MHPNEMVLETLLKIVIKVICEYPEHTMWSLIAVMKSNNYNRSYRGAHIIKALKVWSRGNKLT
jgi:hypothetical protein